MPAGVIEAGPAREEYVRWAVSAERQLGSILGRADAASLFENARHRDICSMPADRQLRTLINAEVTNKVTELQEMAEELKTARARLVSGTGLPTILDTNVLMHAQRPDGIKWSAVVGEPARLMIPLRVIEELDEKKYAKDEGRRDVARDILIWLEALFNGPGTGPVNLQDPDRSTIEILLSDVPRYRPDDADEELLDVYAQVTQFTGRGVLVTADTGMRLRARAQAIDLRSMPDIYLRRRPKAQAEDEASGSIDPPA